MAKIYGVDISKKVTPLMVRDAIIRCFLNAHKEILDEMKEFDDMTDDELRRMEELDVELMIKNFMNELGGNYENPTKESLIKVIDKLKKFAVNFRNPKIVNKHAAQIMQLVDLL